MASSQAASAHCSSSGHSSPFNATVKRITSTEEDSVIEIIDNDTTAGNLLVTNILADCILPVANGGCCSHAIYFDLSQHFDLLRLICVLEGKAKAEESEIRSWMKRLHLIRCRDLHQLIITLLSIEPLIANSKYPVKLMVLDGLGTNYWHEQFVGGYCQYLKEHNYKRLISNLKSMLDKYNFSVLVRTVEIFSQKSKERQVSVTDHRNLQLYGESWAELVSHRFFLSKALKCDGKTSKIFLRNLLLNTESVLEVRDRFIVQ